MNVTSFHIGATPRSSAYAAADVANTPAGFSITGQVARDFQVSNVRPVAPVQNAAEAREQARDQVMAERGVDMISMYKMTAQDRIQAEAAILVETARRTSVGTISATGNFVDMRI
ncbi:MAG: hypothetical protein KKE02_00815 [Alphaproteobacteria bacterium]|nr:hypothetical protein [Alphaproteobacteria bacterium]MBU1515730.1 hypothetical protein [Alphaproteobacteria bacterium]MBU2097013.1 hypothetical protein [Alphaproteobacteria bacterium]MBU2149529.1 hypothetical protein [Alphaproteobacteria bacterium]MBU2308915.1 hypothetical protein [Alphaproteobacteria bacterium]